jgi:hypothetical protein
MSLSIFFGNSWEDITRDERYFCAELYFRMRERPSEFVKWIYQNSLLPGISGGDLTREWNAGLEVCFYRDFIKRFGFKGEKSLRLVNQKNGTYFSEKRTFDLCLFSDKKIVIFEAKVQQPFDEQQVLVFEKDRALLKVMLGEEIEVVFVAIASSEFFKNFPVFGKKVKPAIDKVFGKNLLSWSKLGEESCPVFHKQFKKADALYKQ